MSGETVFEFHRPIVDRDGNTWHARACGRQRDDGKWEGWIEVRSTRDGAVLPTGRETTQPNRSDLVYWATGISNVFLEGALDRARAGRA